MKDSAAYLYYLARVETHRSHNDTTALDGVAARATGIMACPMELSRLHALVRGAQRIIAYRERRDAASPTPKVIQVDFSARR